MFIIIIKMYLELPRKLYSVHKALKIYIKYTNKKYISKHITSEQQLSDSIFSYGIINSYVIPVVMEVINYSSVHIPNAQQFFPESKIEWLKR